VPIISDHPIPPSPSEKDKTASNIIDIYNLQYINFIFSLFSLASCMKHNVARTKLRTTVVCAFT